MITKSLQRCTVKRLLARTFGAMSATKESQAQDMFDELAKGKDLFENVLLVKKTPKFGRLKDSPML